MREEIKKLLPEYRVEIFDTIPSTNTYLCDYARENNIEKTVALARHQSGGRGRRGRTFHSPMDAGLYMSVLLPLEDMAASEGLTVRVGVAILSMLKKRFPTLSPTVKWVNDIYIGDRKLAGILTEGVTRPDGVFCAVVGIGMNVLKCAFPEELSDIVTSLEDETKQKISPTSLVPLLIREIERTLSLEQNEVIALYRENSYLKGKTLSVIPHGNDLYTARYVDIDEDGALLVETENGEIVRLFSGDVSVKKQ